jgi:hypothetical protein
MNRRDAFATLAGTIFIAGLKTANASDQDSYRDHANWVQQVLIRMQAVKPGMTRAELLRPFTTEGGLSTGLQRTYVSRDCPYFKVDVKFRAFGRPDQDSDGRVTLVEDPRDQIVTISRPYVEFSIAD